MDSGGFYRIVSEKSSTPARGLLKSKIARSGDVFHPLSRALVDVLRTLFQLIKLVFFLHPLTYCHCYNAATTKSRSASSRWTS